MAALFILVIGLICYLPSSLSISLMLLRQKSAIKRNYPVVGHFRYFFEHIGEFFRQYFFAMDREELPFNRAQRFMGLQGSKKYR